MFQATFLGFGGASENILEEFEAGFNSGGSWSVSGGYLFQSLLSANAFSGAAYGSIATHFEDGQTYASKGFVFDGFTKLVCRFGAATNSQYGYANGILKVGGAIPTVLSTVDTGIASAFSTWREITFDVSGVGPVGTIELSSQFAPSGVTHMDKLELVP